MEKQKDIGSETQCKSHIMLPHLLIQLCRVLENTQIRILFQELDNFDVFPIGLQIIAKKLQTEKLYLVKRRKIRKKKRSGFSKMNAILIQSLELKLQQPTQERRIILQMFSASLNLSSNQVRHIEQNVLQDQKEEDYFVQIMSCVRDQQIC